MIVKTSAGKVKEHTAGNFVKFDHPEASCSVSFGEDNSCAIQQNGKDVFDPEVIVILDAEEVQQIIDEYARTNPLKLLKYITKLVANA